MWFDTNISLIINSIRKQYIRNLVDIQKNPTETIGKDILEI
jgi:hypothetical protein